MDGSHEGSGSSSPAPFLTKTYEMVDDPATDAVVSWSSTSSSFVVWKPLEFARDLLPKYFKHNNFSSFVRQLNTYGFRKADPDQWEFANEEFVQGQRQLLKNIHRRKPVHSHSLQPNASRHLAEEEKHELEEEIEKLRREKGTLILELEKHSQQQHGMERQMQCLEERLHLVEQRQRGIVSFLGKVAQRPGFLSDLLYKSDLHHKRRLPKLDYLFQDANVEDDQIVAFETMSLEKHNHGGIQIFDTEPFDKMDSCIHSLEVFFLGAIDATVGSMCYDDGLPSQPCLEDIHSSSELVESMSHVASENQKDEDRDVLEMDVKSETSVHEIHTSTNQATKTTAIVNDVFWEQFLTETPASSQTQEAFQLECKDVKDDQRNVERRS